MSLHKRIYAQRTPVNCAFCGGKMMDWEILLSDTHAKCIRKQIEANKEKARKEKEELLRQQQKSLF